MVGSINKVILVGNLGADPKVANTANGAKIVNLNVATSDSWKDKLSGERKERTEWHRVVIFNSQLADIAERYLRKGSKVYLEGSLQTRRWEDNNGQEKYTTEVVLQNFSGNLVLLDGRGDGVPAGGNVSSPVRLPIPDGITPRRLLLLLIWTMIFRSKLLITKKRFVTEPLFCYILCSPCKSQGAGTTPLCAADYPLGFAGEYLCQSFLCFKWRFFAFFCFFC